MPSKAMRTFQPFALCVVFFLSVTATLAQRQYPKPAEPGEPVEEVFRSFWNVNGYSTEMTWKHYLNFAITHRFTGYLNDGIREFFGMDKTGNIRFALMYGLTDDINMGIGRTKIGKVYDGFVKVRALKQRHQSTPVTLVFLGSASVMTDAWNADQEEVLDFRHRMSYLGQALISRKFGNRLSLQVSPTIVHRNLGTDAAEENTTFSIGGAASYKISELISLQAEYYHRLSENTLESRTVKNIFGLSIDFYSPRHAFQLQFSNTADIQGEEFLTQTTDDFFDGDIHIGFHIIRRIAL